MRVLSQVERSLYRSLLTVAHGDVALVREAIKKNSSPNGRVKYSDTVAYIKAKLSQPSTE